MADADAIWPGPDPDHIYEDAYRQLIKAAIEFGRADEHRQVWVTLADEHPEVTQYRQPVPVQVSEAIILELWNFAREHYEAAERESGEEFPDALMDGDQMHEWECQMEVARLALLEVMDHLYVSTSSEEGDDESPEADPPS